jgi:FlaA1/EpsC-like NDP-sugar epimerase
VCRLQTEKHTFYTEAVIPRNDSGLSGSWIDWYAFLERPRLPSPGVQSLDQLRDLSIVVTGAGGSIGSALSLRLAGLHPRRLVLIDASEQALYRLRTSLAETDLPVLHLALANVMDAPHLDEIFEAHRPGLVFHAAAYKHVPLLEEHPLEAIANNALGTLTISEAAKKFGIGRIVLLSTDKAAEPASILGASKHIAEMITVANGWVAVRLANVLGTEGSVSEVFLRQIAAGGPITITDPEAERYFVTCEEAVDLLLASAVASKGGSLLAPNLNRQYSVAHLAEFLVSACSPAVRLATVITGLRPGDKKREVLWSASEQPCVTDVEGCFEIQQRALDHECLYAYLRDQLTRLDDAVRERDLPRAVKIVQALVPDYTASASVRSLLQKAERGVMPG